MADRTRILVVDDERSITDLVAMALKYEGFDVAAAASAREARRSVMEFRPDLIVLDVGLPDEDGFSVVQKLLSDGLKVPPNIMLHLLPPYSPELNPQENLWDEIREKIFKNYALKSIDEVYSKLEEAALYIERNPAIVKSITSFPYIVRSI